MDALKNCIYLVVVMMCINAVAMMMTSIGMINMTTFNATNVNTALYANDIVNSWGWEDNPFYDIGTGLLSFWTRAYPIIDSLPYMLAAYGCPSFIYVPVVSIWHFMWMVAVALGIIAGRTT